MPLPDEIAQLFTKNPEAGALALGMELMAQSSEQSHSIMSNLYENALERIKELERENVELREWAVRYWQIRGALTLQQELP